LCFEEVRALLALVRTGNPNASVVILSPLLRMDAEDKPNRLGSTLTELRIAMEEAVRERILAGDSRLHLIEGSTIVGPGDMADGIYPGDEGHIRIAAAVGKVVSPIVGELRTYGDERRAVEEAAADQMGMPDLPSTDFLRHVATPGMEPVGHEPDPPRPAFAASSYVPQPPQPVAVPRSSLPPGVQIPSGLAMPPPPPSPTYSSPPETESATESILKRPDSMDFLAHAAEMYASLGAIPERISAGGTDPHAHDSDPQSHDA
jgi:hypothetical protein